MPWFDLPLDQKGGGLALATAALVPQVVAACRGHSSKSY